MEPFATLDELKSRCDWTFDADEERAAPGYLEEASDLARAYGRMTWDVASTPRQVKNMVISAVRRFMRNPEGYQQSRAGDETLMWADLGHDAASIYFTHAEQKLLRTLAGNNGGLRSAGLSAWGGSRKPTRLTEHTVPVAGHEGEPAFPYFGDETEPW